MSAQALDQDEGGQDHAAHRTERVEGVDARETAPALIAGGRDRSGHRRERAAHEHGRDADDARRQHQADERAAEES